MAAAIMFYAATNAQQWTGTLDTTGFITRAGKVSIGTDSDKDKLNLNGNLRITGNPGNRIAFGGAIGNTNGSKETDYGSYHIEYSGSFLYIHPYSNFYSSSTPNPNPILKKSFSMGISGLIGMGTDNINCTNCDGYRLFVKDGIKTEKVKVEIAQGTWADYVFKKDYKLMSLNTLEEFININGHLPEVPTTEQAIADGIELKAMNILLLKKVEELTLYAIGQNKRIEALEKIVKEKQ